MIGIPGYGPSEDTLMTVMILPLTFVLTGILVAVALQAAAELLVFGQQFTVRQLFCYTLCVAVVIALWTAVLA